MWNMNTNLTQRSIFAFGLILLFLLFWSAYDYGGRYLHVQTLSQVLSGGLILWCARRFDYPQSYQHLKHYPLLWPSLLWLGSFALSFVFSANQLASLEEIARLLMYVSVSICAYLWLQQFDTADMRQRALEYAMRCVVAMGLVIVGFGWAFQTQNSSLAGTFYRTNDLAGYLLLLCPLALGGFFINTQTRWKSYYALSGLILWASLISTNSRTSWMAMICSLLLVAMAYRRQILTKKGGAVLGVMAILLMGALAMNWGALAPRISSLTQLTILKENATSWRVHLLQGAWQMFKARPVLGYGPNTFGLVLPQYMTAAGYFSINPHNYYLQTLAETGLVGALCFLTWLGALGRSILKRSNPYSIPLGAALLASLIHIGFDIDWSVTAIPLLFFTLTGLALSSTSKQVFAPVNYLPYSHVSRVLLACVGTALVLVPSLNYFSAQAYVKGMQAQSAGDLPTAQKNIQRAMQLAPWPSARHYHAQATLYNAQNKKERALVSGLRAIQIDTHNANYYRLPSEILLASSKPEHRAQAVELLERRLALNPYRHPAVYTELAELYWRVLSKPELAESLYEKGADLFSEKNLARYESYTPSDRYELFMLLQSFAALKHKQGQSAQANTLQEQAQAILQNTPKDRYILSGIKTPTQAIEQYWQSIAKADIAGREAVVHPEALFGHPPEGIFKTTPDYQQAERGIASARLQYKIETTEEAQTSRKAPAFLWFETQLAADASGWKIITHRNIENSSVFAFESLP